MTLQKKILALTIGGTLLVGMIQVSLIRVLLSRDLSSELKSQGVFLAKQLARASVDDILTERYLSLQLTIDYYQEENDDIQYVFIQDEAGALLISTFKGGFPAKLTQVNLLRDGQAYNIQHLVTDQGHILDVAVPVLKGELGTLHVGFSESHLEQYFNKIINLTGGMTLAILFLGTIIVIFFASRITKSISELMIAATEIGWGNFEYKVQVKGQDEIGQLGVAFNRMVDALQKTTASRDYIDNIIDNMGSALMVLSPLGKIEKVNQSLQRLSGFTEKELLAQTVDLLFPPAFTGKTEGEAIFSILFREKRVVNLERICLAKDGRAIPVFFSGTLIPAADGKIKRIVCVLQDISEHKSIEEALNKESQRNTRLLTFLSSILIGLDIGNNIIQWNVNAEKTFGIAAGDVLGKSFEECGLNWDWVAVIHALYISMQQEQSVQINELRFQDAAGKERFLRLTINSIKDEIGKHSEVLLLGQDITEYKMLESQLVQSQKLESIGQLAAGIAHEINTPMQYVGDNTHFLEDSFLNLSKLLTEYDKLLYEAKNCDSGNCAALKNLVQEVEAAAATADLEFLKTEIPQAISQSISGIETVSRIVRAMKEFSHPGSAEKSPVDLNQAIENTILVTRNEWKYIADVVTDFAPNLPLVPCQAGEFNQVILNIIVNATQAIAEAMEKEPDKKGTITISTRLAGDWVEIRLADTGPGIPDNIKTKVFDPFFTTKPVGKGTGQGLAIARSVIVEKHQGTITLESQVGQGTTFIIRLPLTAALTSEESQT